MHFEPLFTTPLWINHLDLDNDRLTKVIHNLQSQYESVNVSNVGGWQSPLPLEDKEFITAIKSSIPTREDKPLGMDDFDIYSWININKKGNYNNRHTHHDSNIFLCGVYYVKVPEDCGKIRLWDPRGVLHQTHMDHVYFNDGNKYNFVNIEEGMVIYFPSWLEHDVMVSDTDEERISVAFNIFVDRNMIRGMHPHDFKGDVVDTEPPLK